MDIRLKLIQYVPGEIPSRNGVSLYTRAPPASPFGLSQNNPQKRTAVTPDVQTYDRIPGTQTTRRTPSPGEEYFRSRQIVDLRESCERICNDVFQSPLPKDILDQCIFIGRDSLGSLQKDEEEYRDPIFPQTDLQSLYKVIVRELYGDVIGRFIPKNKQRSIRHVVSSLAHTFQRSSHWISFFSEFTRSPAAQRFFKCNVTPLSVLAYSDLRVSFQPLPIPEHMNVRGPDDPLCPLAWVVWIQRTKAQIRDHTAEFIRYLDIIENSRMRNSALEDVFFQRSNIVLSNVMTSMYPIMYIFLSKAAQGIVKAIKEYQKNMKHYVTSHPSDTEDYPLCQLSFSGVNKCVSFYDSEIVISYRDDKVKCRQVHFEKYIRLYLWNLGLGGSNITSLKKVLPPEDPVRNATTRLSDFLDFPLDIQEENKLLTSIYVMMRRYANVIYCPQHFPRGGNMHAAAPGTASSARYSPGSLDQYATLETVFHYLQNVCHVEMECFASPNNCFFTSFFSAFPDTDCAFGSRGNFFDTVFLPSGAYEVGPPYTEEMLLCTIRHLEYIMRNATQSSSLTFFVFVPDWLDCHGLALMKKSCWLSCIVTGEENEHLYVTGVQHIVEHKTCDRYYRPPHATLCFIFQSDSARKTFPITDSIQQVLSDRMQGILTNRIERRNNCSTTIDSPKTEGLYKSPYTRQQPRLSHAPVNQNDWWNTLTLHQKPIVLLLKSEIQVPPSTAKDNATENTRWKTSKHGSSFVSTAALSSLSWRKP